MKEITKLMIREYKIKELGFDFMGYKLQKDDIYTFHHLIIPYRDGGKEKRENGAILCGRTSHPYLHLIEAKENKYFCYITSEMIDMNIKGYLDPFNIERINDILNEFEYKHKEDRTRKGKILIKEEYKNRILNK